VVRRQKPCRTFGIMLCVDYIIFKLSLGIKQKIATTEIKNLCNWKKGLFRKFTLAGEITVVIHRIFTAFSPHPQYVISQKSSPNRYLKRYLIITFHISHVPLCPLMSPYVPYKQDSIYSRLLYLFCPS